MRWMQPGKRGVLASRLSHAAGHGAPAAGVDQAGRVQDSLDRRLRHAYGEAGQAVDYAGVDRRLRARLIAVSDDLAGPLRQRPGGARRTLALSVAALLLLGGGVLAVAAHVLPDDVPPPSIQSQLSDILSVGSQRPITRAQAGIWLTSLPCTPTASKRAGETTWHLVRDCPIPYKITPQIPDSVGSQARWDVLMMIALQHYQDYWAAHPGWSAATAPRVDAQAQLAVAHALDDYLDGKPVTIRYGSVIHVQGGETLGPERLRDAHAVERERAAMGR